MTMKMKNDHEYDQNDNNDDNYKTMKETMRQQ